MSRTVPTILVADDDKDVREYLELALRFQGVSVVLAEDGQEAIDLFVEAPSRFAAVVVDLIMPRRDGLSTLQEIRRMDRALPLFALSGANSPSNVMEAMKAGASDFIQKPVSADDLSRIVRGCHCAPLPNVPNTESDKPAGLIYTGASPATRQVQNLLRRIGNLIPTVLILGETGSGKEVLARELHRISPRANQPFFKLNCAALPSELVESELFGYERGAFTGAFQRKAGMFEMADGGTIFLDEIGDMDFKLQAKLLQVLQDHEFQRLGGKETVTVDVRVIAATHRDLETAIRDGSFREDLYYRLNIINIVVPPLRERPEDIIGIAEVLLEKHRSPGGGALPLPPSLKDALLKHVWPGNIRELENTMRRYLVFRDPEVIAAELRSKANRRQPVLVMSNGTAPTSENTPAVAPKPSTGPEISSLSAVTKAKEEAESAAILNALQATRWNRKRAAALLNIEYKALLYRMKKLSLLGRPEIPTIYNDL
jgi:two-component system, NtrC family, response regulator AtoC